MQAWDFHEGRAAVKVEDKFGFIDQIGQVVIPPRFDRVAEFSEGLAAVEVGRKWGIVDPNGKLVIPPRFTSAGNFHEGRARREPRPPQSPRSLSELYAWLKDVLLDDGFCSYELPEDFLTRFAFHHLEGDKVAVRLALPYFVEICRGKYLELDLLLPVPESLKEPLALAQTGKAGFLMQDQRPLSGERTIMRFTKGKKKAEPAPE